MVQQSFMEMEMKWVHFIMDRHIQTDRINCRQWLPLMQQCGKCIPVYDVPFPAPFIELERTELLQYIHFFPPCDCYLCDCVIIWLNMCCVLLSAIYTYKFLFQLLHFQWMNVDLCLVLFQTFSSVVQTCDSTYTHYLHKYYY